MPLLRILAVLLIAAVFAWTAAPVPAAYGGEARSPGTPGQQGELHRVIRAAIKDLEHTKSRLQNRADNDFGGHRVNAINAIDQALQELQLALEFKPKN
jgi:hypothetical protein